MIAATSFVQTHRRPGVRVRLTECECGRRTVQVDLEARRIPAAEPAGRATNRPCDDFVAGLPRRTGSLAEQVQELVSTVRDRLGVREESNDGRTRRWPRRSNWAAASARTSPTC